MRYLSLLTLSLSACNPCESSSPPPTELNFFLVSPAGQNRLGTGPGQYAPDSVRISYHGRPCRVEVVPESQAGRPAGPLVSLTTQPYLTGVSPARFLLHLSSRDTDTLMVTYAIREGKCASQVEYQQVLLNGRRMPVADEGYYQLVKP